MLENKEIFAAPLSLAFLGTSAVSASTDAQVKSQESSEKSQKSDKMLRESRMLKAYGRPSFRRWRGSTKTVFEPKLEAEDGNIEPGLGSALVEKEHRETPIDSTDLSVDPDLKVGNEEIDNENRDFEDKKLGEESIDQKGVVSGDADGAEINKDEGSAESSDSVDDVVSDKKIVKRPKLVIEGGVEGYLDYEASGWPKGWNTGTYVPKKVKNGLHLCFYGGPPIFRTKEEYEKRYGKVEGDEKRSEEKIEAKNYSYENANEEKVASEDSRNSNKDLKDDANKSDLVEVAKDEIVDYALDFYGGPGFYEDDYYIEDKDYDEHEHSADKDVNTENRDELNCVPEYGAPVFLKRYNSEGEQNSKSIKGISYMKILGVCLSVCALMVGAGYMFSNEKILNAYGGPNFFPH